MSDNKHISVFKLLKKFESRITVYQNESRKSFRKVFLSFKNFIFSRYLSDLFFNESLVCDWYLFLLLKGITPSKAFYYVDKLGNLYAGVLKGEKTYDPSLFKDLRKKIKSVSQLQEAIPFITFTDCSALINYFSETSDDGNNLGRDLFLFSLCCGGLQIEDLVLLKKESVAGFNPVAVRITQKYSDPRRKYIFPLEQSHKTHHQAAEYVSSLVSTFLSSLSFLPLALKDKCCQTEKLNFIIYGFWVSLAVFSGISPSVIASLEKTLILYPSFEICKKTQLNEDEWKRIYARVAEFISADKDKWFAMHLRQRVRYEELIARLSTFDHISSFPELFYPCEEISKKVGRALVWKEKPVIRDIVFFKYRPSDVYSLFRNIGDLAWCYRDASFGAYAIIPAKAIEDFQRAIGIFTSEFEVAPIGEMEIKPGDKVIVVGGDFVNQMGKVIRQEKQKETESNIIYRIRLLDSNADWTIGIDSRLIRHA